MATMALGSGSPRADLTKESVCPIPRRRAVTLPLHFPPHARALSQAPGRCRTHVIAAVGITGTFFVFAVLGAVSWIFCFKAVPETRGRTLEQLELEVTTGAIYLPQNLKA
jgi:hypothetical protein